MLGKVIGAIVVIILLILGALIAFNVFDTGQPQPDDFKAAIEGMPLPEETPPPPSVGELADAQKSADAAAIPGEEKTETPAAATTEPSPTLAASPVADEVKAQPDGAAPQPAATDNPLLQPIAPTPAPAAPAEVKAESSATPVAAPVVEAPKVDAPAASPTPAAEAKTDVPAAAPAPAQAPVAVTPPPAPASMMPTKELLLADRTIGRDDAPVTMVEYFSYTCPHCARFKLDVLPSIIEKFVNTGQVRIVFRDFPTSLPATQAAKLSRCVPVDRYKAYATAIMSTQTKWLSESDPLPHFVSYAKQMGLTDGDIDVCLKDDDLNTIITQRVQEASLKYRVRSTPTFVLNDKTIIVGNQSLADFNLQISQVLAAAKQAAAPAAQ